MYIGLLVLFTSDFNETCISSNFMKIRTADSEFSMQTEGQRDRRDERNSRVWEFYEFA